MSLAGQLDSHVILVFRAVAQCGSFTSAAERVGLTQSAVSRQIKALEENVGVRLFERTTRKVRLTEAGEYWLGECDKTLAQYSASLANLRAQFSERSSCIRLGISNTITFSHLPGVIASFHRESPEVKIDMLFDEGDLLIKRMQNLEIDLAILTSRSNLPPELEEVHQFEDSFVGIAPPRSGDIDDLSQLPWIGIGNKGETGKQLGAWLVDQVPGVSPSITAESFDLIMNLVSLGMGVSLVPARTLASYGRRKPVQKWTPKKSFARQVSIIARTDAGRADLLNRFVESILFSNG